MRRAINEIDSADAPLTLDDLASRMKMSPAHFQRLFSAWVGVSPKRYQQYLTIDHARSLLAHRHTTLDTALQTGLSGTGRLHDLFLTWEAMSPGEYAAGGDGLMIRWSQIPTPFGPALVMVTDKGICGIAFTAETGPGAAWADMAARWPKAAFKEDDAAIRQLAGPVFAGRGETRLHMLGAPFQIKVWEALLQIPSGHVATYSDIARRIGADRAVRAVGTAVGRNPVSFLIPCHRAIRKSGGLGGYHWGLPVKRAMLAWESARTDSL
ncbi:methylated-DNA--[protein]-cysteine S-methyltransferase [Pseudooceanicola algae]|nr:methylated-DNA--[protein]-cysteine S-methyltransferase [Pseudooceanicola algae]